MQIILDGPRSNDWPLFDQCCMLVIFCSLLFSLASSHEFLFIIYLFDLWIGYLSFLGPLQTEAQDNVQPKMLNYHWWIVMLGPVPMQIKTQGQRPKILLRWQQNWCAILGLEPRKTDYQTAPPLQVFGYDSVFCFFKGGPHTRFLDQLFLGLGPLSKVALSHFFVGNIICKCCRHDTYKDATLFKNMKQVISFRHYLFLNPYLLITSLPYISVWHLVASAHWW